MQPSAGVTAERPPSIPGRRIELQRSRAALVKLQAIELRAYPKLANSAMPAITLVDVVIGSLPRTIATPPEQLTTASSPTPMFKSSSRAAKTRIRATTKQRTLIKAAFYLAE